MQNGEEKKGKKWSDIPEWIKTNILQSLYVFSTWSETVCWVKKIPTDKVYKIKNPIK